MEREAPQRRKAVFLDRDGVVNSDEGRYYVHRLPDFVLTPQLGEALRRLRDAGFLLIIITNQSGVARGAYTLRDVEQLHDALRERLSAHGVALAEVYACPHHPDHGRCLCRKPQPLLVQKALARFGIDPARSYFIGDRESDLETARRAGVAGILVASNRGIAEAVEGIVGGRLERGGVAGQANPAPTCEHAVRSMKRHLT
ncbi:MAG: HAD family hydrolase [Prevotellaceae bacterium]|jgi:D-glycero-D-manno-heptose 1,7-bisphosphate phosphatase|nr:HAD family hydrolase [Prevotellaceae bacterium]